MKINKAIEIAGLLTKSYTYTPIENNIYVNGYYSLHEMMYDKLFLVLNERFALENDFSKSNVFHTPEHRWEVNGKCDNLSKNLYISNMADKWMWNRISGCGDAPSIASYLRVQTGCSTSYDIFPLLFAMWSILYKQYPDFSKEYEDCLIPLDMIDEMLEEYGFYDCFHVKKSDQLAFKKRVQNEMCYLARYIYQASIEMEYPSDVRYEQIFSLTEPDISIDGYASELVEILSDCFFDSISKKAFFRILPQFLSFLGYPEYMVYSNETSLNTFWVYENEQLFSYIKWREKSKKSSKILRAMDQLLPILLHPFGTVNDYSIIQNYTFTKKSVVIWAVTGDLSITRSNPCFYAARKAWETLYPVWEKRYYN